MYIDKELLFSDEQAITGDAKSTDKVDLGAANSPFTDSDQTVGDDPMYLVVVVDETFDNLTTLDITLQSDSTANLATSPTAHASRSIALAALTAGGGAFVIGSFSGPVNERYIGVDYDVVGANPTAGKVTAFLTRNPQQNPPD